MPGYTGDIQVLQRLGGRVTGCLVKTQELYILQCEFEWRQTEKKKKNRMEINTHRTVCLRYLHLTMCRTDPKEMSLTDVP